MKKVAIILTITLIIFSAVIVLHIITYTGEAFVVVSESAIPEFNSQKV